MFKTKYYWMHYNKILHLCFATGVHSSATELAVIVVTLGNKVIVLGVVGSSKHCNISTESGHNNKSWHCTNVW